MAKTKWSEVQASIELRRDYGRDDDKNKAPKSHGSRTNIFTLANCEAVRAIPNKLDSQSTLAVGVGHGTSGSVMLVARKGVSDAVMDDLSTARNMLLPSASVADVTGIASGLHAEMAIVQYFAKTYGVSKGDLRYYLQICCIGKKVCLDCAGWMNKNGIGHLSVLPDENLDGVVEFKPGGVSTMGGGMWQNPLSGARYGGGNDPNSYQKPGKTINRPLMY